MRVDQTVLTVKKRNIKSREKKVLTISLKPPPEKNSDEAASGMCAVAPTDVTLNNSVSKATRCRTDNITYKGQLI